LLIAVLAAGKQPFIAAPVVGVSGLQDPPLQEWDDTVVAFGSKESAVKARSLCQWARRPDVSSAALSVPISAGSGNAAVTRIASGDAAQALLHDIAAAWPDGCTVASVEEAEAALEKLKFPLVIKAEAGLAHRASRGGVLTGIDDRQSALLAVQLLLRRFRAKVAIAEEIPHDRELTLGYQLDPASGPLLMFGIGGSDVGAGVEFRRLPMSRGQVRALIEPYVPAGRDRDALETTIMSFQVHVLRRPGLISLDLNPLVVLDGATYLLDAKLHVSDEYGISRARPTEGKDHG
jgi:hypothetical protein